MSRLVLVTGGAGFMGSHLVDKLINEGYRVRVIDNLSTGRMENLEHLEGNPNLEIIRGDLKNVQDAKEAVRDVNAVFHFAANPEVRVSTTNPEMHFNENIVATFNLLEAMRKKDVKEIVFASSSSVYGEPEKIPVSEEAPIRPVSVYGASKAACENLIHAYSRLYSIKAVVLRYANVIGPRLRHGVVWDLMQKLKRNPVELEILGDGTQVRSYIHIDDAVDGTMVAWRKSKKDSSVFNIASSDWVTVDQVASIVIETLGLKNVRKVYKPYGQGIGWPGDVKRIALDTTKLMALGFVPSLNSIDAIRKTVETLKECSVCL
jgi:UDP-glucose 4-epimerase